MGEFITTLTVLDQRVVAVFPAIGGVAGRDGQVENPWLADAVVVTTDDAPKKTFRLVRVERDGQPVVGSHCREFTTFPAAIRAARQALGWG
jgi:hypothetical protein